MNHILAVACASITGISLGVALQHKTSLGAILPMAAPHGSMVDQPVSDSYSSSNPLRGKNHQSMLTTHAGNASHLDQKLNKLAEQQETMQSQQSELNREVHAMQFRLDTHSSSFRPLLSERDSEPLNPSPNPGTLTPLLPPLR